LKDGEIWLRNSIPLDYWQLGLSDLDISVKVHGGAANCALIWKRLQKNKLLTLGGEIQIYSDIQLEQFLVFCNFFEALRDPYLAQRITRRTTPPAEAERLVFLLRMLASDKGLLKYPDLRRKKWEMMLSLVGISTPSVIDVETITQIVCQRDILRGSNILSELPEALRGLSALGLRDMLILAPNRVYMNETNRHEFQLVLDNLKPQLHEIIHQHQRWEIWGLSCFTPITCKFSKENLIQHARNQVQLNEMLRIPESSKMEIKSGFDALLNYYETIAF
jgi:hypothetical protein